MNHYFTTIEASMFDYDDASLEDFQEILHKVIVHVASMCGNYNAMIQWLNDNNEKMNNLPGDAMLRTVMPSDLEIALHALNQANECIKELSRGKPLDFEDYSEAFGNAGIDYKQDGRLYNTRFRTGQWGEGKGKTAIHSPMTFRKTISEFGWDKCISEMAADFASCIKEFTESKMKSAVNRHYSDLKSAMMTKSEKDVVLSDKQVVCNQMKNLMEIRDSIVGFCFKQFKLVIRTGIERSEQDSQEALEAMLLAVHPDTTPFL